MITNAAIKLVGTEDSKALYKVNPKRLALQNVYPIICGNCKLVDGIKSGTYNSKTDFDYCRKCQTVVKNKHDQGELFEVAVPTRPLPESLQKEIDKIYAKEVKAQPPAQTQAPVESPKPSRATWLHYKVC